MADDPGLCRWCERPGRDHGPDHGIVGWHRYLPPLDEEDGGTGIVDELTERLWEAVAEVRDQHPRVFNDAPTDDVVAAVLPTIAAEVRKAKAEAWDDCAHEADRRWLIGGQSAAILHDRNPYRETGDRDEHR